MNRVILTIFAMAFFFTSCKEEGNKTDNLLIFAKVYGYVKYFHPSEEASNIKWKEFAAYGAKKIIECDNEDEVITTLNDLFSPIAPSIRFTRDKKAFDLKIITPTDTSNYKPIYWQHLGVSKDMKYNYNLYKSVRVNGTYPEANKKNKIKRVKGSPIFESYPKFGELIEKEIAPGIFCQIPLNLYGKENTTYPESTSFESLQKELMLSDKIADSLSVRLGNIINTYNVFQHFYPYFEEVDVDWNMKFKNALERSFKDKTSEDHRITLEKFTAHLKDGHIYVRGSEKNNYYQPPFHWELIENKLVITHTYDDNTGLKIGDIVTEINGQTVEELFDELTSRISAGTAGRRNYIAEGKALFGKKGSKISVQVDNDVKEFERNTEYSIRASSLPIQNTSYKKLADSIYYLNLYTIPMDTINSLLPKLEAAKGIICDLRIFPNGNHDLIGHLLKENDTSKGWMKIPQIIYPNQEKIVGYEEHDWGLEAQKPYLGDKKIVFLTGGAAVSYAESYMSFIEGYDLGTIVGQPTAGTNGSMNSFGLLDDYSISWTGMKVVKHDGSQHHAIGILPDVYVERTIAGVKAGKDEALEKAIEIITK